MILAKRLNESGLPVEAIVFGGVGYPKDASVLEDAATIVIFCTRHGGHVLNPKLKEFDALMKETKDYHDSLGNRGVEGPARGSGFSSGWVDSAI